MSPFTTRDPALPDPMAIWERPPGTDPDLPHSELIAADLDVQPRLRRVSSHTTIATRANKTESSKTPTSNMPRHYENTASVAP